MRKSVLVAAVLVVILSLSALAVERTVIKIKVLLDERPVKETDLSLIEGMGYLRVRDIGNVLGANIDVDSEIRKVTLRGKNRNIVFAVNTPDMVIGGVARRMKKNTELIENEVWIPLEGVISSSFGDAMDCSIAWKYEEKVLAITSSGEETKNDTESAVKNKKPAEEKSAEPKPAIQVEDTGINISATRVYSYRNYTRLVIEMLRELDYTVEKQDASRIAVQITGGRIDTASSSFEVKDGTIKNIKADQFPLTVLITLTLTPDAGEYKVMRLKYPERIVVDIKRTAPAPVPPAQPAAEGVKKQEIKTIIIDPGHGGKDPGAIGPSGEKEKDIVLKISRYLADYLSRRLKLKVVLTRNADFFLPLDQRTAIANQKKADLFVSIHCNASLKESTRGFEIYFLSEKASDAQAQAVANAENAVLNLEGGEEDSRLSPLLKSLAMNEYMNESSECCSFIEKEVENRVNVENKGTKQAGFYVLRGADMPSILIECAFISNKLEERKLKSGWFQKEIAEGIYQGIRAYKKWMEK